MPPVTCFICEKDLGSKSIGNHVSMCKKKWETEQSKLPKKDRKELPKAPKEFEKFLTNGTKTKEQIPNGESKESNLERCKFCER